MDRIQTAFTRLTNEGNEGAFVIFTNPDTGKFVQFAYSVEAAVLLIDIPLIELSKDEEEKIQSLLGDEGAINVDTGEKVSYQETFNVDEVDDATELTEKIFRDVFNLPASYTIDCELELGS